MSWSFLRRRLRRKHHVLPHDDGWEVRSRRKASIHRSKKRALAAAARAAREQGTMLIIHGRDGRVQETRNYGA